MKGSWLLVFGFVVLGEDKLVPGAPTSTAGCSAVSIQTHTHTQKCVTVNLQQRRNIPCIHFDVPVLCYFKKKFYTNVCVL